jgi:hypothetical protein
MRNPAIFYLENLKRRDEFKDKREDLGRIVKD